MTHGERSVPRSRPERTRPCPEHAGPGAQHAATQHAAACVAAPIAAR
jgi:hypothetical protein